MTKLTDKLYFYIGFLERFVKDTQNIIDATKHHRLAMTLEYLIDAVNRIIDLEKENDKLQNPKP